MRPAADHDLLALARPVTPGVRARIEAHVESMIRLLDELDGDPDLEDACEDEGSACEDEGSRDRADVHPLDRPARIARR